MIANKFYAHECSPSVSPEWQRLGNDERISAIHRAIKDFEFDFCNQISIISASKDGQIIVKLLNSLGAAERGTLLLNFESLIKNKLDKGITVWGEALGDKNSLRNLRGIEVKSL